MALIEVLQQGAVTVIDYRCTCRPGDRPFAERHRFHSLSFVRKGSFACEHRGRTMEFVPGSLFVGYPDDEYTCTHSHLQGGDECLSFQFTPEQVDDVAPDARWRIGYVPPLAGFMVLAQRAQAIVEGRSDLALDEIGLMIGERFAALAATRERSRPRLTALDRNRAIESALWMQEHADEPIDLARAARVAGLSSCHFLRVFSAVLGVTPHQYLVRSRLQVAARLLIEEQLPVTEVAFESGFNDVSNFVRTFGRAAGMSPRAFRASARRRNFFQVPAATLS